MRLFKRLVPLSSAVTARTREAPAEGAQEAAARGDQDRGQVLRGDPRAGVQVPRALQPPPRDEDQEVSVK